MKMGFHLLQVMKVVLITFRSNRLIAPQQEFFLSSLYTGQIPLEGEQVLLTQTHFTPVSLSFTVTDTLGYSCLYTFNLFDGVLELDYSTITGVKSITMYPANDAVGANNNFL